MTWNVASDDEHFMNFGVIQMNPTKIKREQKMFNMPSYFPLIDRSDSIDKVFYAETDADHWYGAIYYKILKTQTQKGTYYTLLGWDGATNKSNKKIMDVLFFKDNEPYFGAPIFDIKTKQPLYRMIWEFNNNATMTLRYEEKRKLLIYENIIPPKPDNVGMYETYVPDGSYDYMIWNGKVWEKQKGICVLTNKVIPQSEINDITKWEADHKIAYSKGGKTDAENCQLVCKIANKQKGSGEYQIAA
jgi:hypothetical protein